MKASLAKILTLAATTSLTLTGYALPSTQPQPVHTPPETITHATGTTDPEWPQGDWRSCSSPVWQGSTPQSDPSRILIIGDSLTRESRDRLETKLDRKGWNPVTRCWGGKGSEWGAEQVKRARTLKQFPRTVVVALGTNDIWWLGVPMETAVDRMMKAIGPKRKVYWVNLWFGPNNYGLEEPEEANRILNRKQRQYRNLHIIDFATQYAQAIKDDPQNGWTDGVHLNATGYKTRARIITSSVGSPR